LAETQFRLKHAINNKVFYYYYALNYFSREKKTSLLITRSFEELTSKTFNEQNENRTKQGLNNGF